MMETAEEDVVAIKRRPLDDNEMDITPMIDITFLLLIFFVVSSKLEENNTIPLPPAQNGAVISKVETVILSVLNVPDELPKVYKGEGANDSERILANTAIEQDEAVAEYVEEELAKSAEKTSVLIQADKALHSREVQRIARAACRSGNVKLFFKIQEE